MEFSKPEHCLSGSELATYNPQPNKLEKKLNSEQSYTNIVNIAGEKKDSNWWDWIPHTSFFFTILSFFFTFWYTRRVTRKNKRDSVNDLFWLREVIFPNVINHSLELVNSGPSKYRENNSDPEQFFRNYYLGMANTLRDRCIVATVISEEFKDEVETIIDDLDALIPEVRNEDELKLLLSNFITAFFLKLKKEQFN
ncbi:MULTISPECIES: hypothetical protein [Pseudoalteromonas]|uniref:hypothetical protein n=1 Tax=Pseudoalteromonas TaxID=53246 RepID=UPI001110A06A|nr:MULTISPECIES: hypothetical protein [Pseudoalteromonas]